MNKKTLVSEIMTAQVVTVGPYETMQVVGELFQQNHFHHLPVADEHGKLIGMVTFTDYMRVIRDIFGNPRDIQLDDKYLSSILVKDLMTDDVIAVDRGANIEELLRLFKINRFHAVPVIDKHYKVEGIVTSFDLLLVLETLLR